MKQVILDFFQLGFMRIISRILSGVRGIVIVTTLLPSELGQYTIWILFFFYFSIADFGILSGLERDIPHHKGKEDEQALKDVLNIGMSSFFVLSFSASLLLGIVTFIVYQKWLLSVLLGTYLLTDKIYRSYWTNAKIHFRYRLVGKAELILAISSLVIVWFCLPHYGSYSIFVAMNN